MVKLQQQGAQVHLAEDRRAHEDGGGGVKAEGDRNTPAEAAQANRQGPGLDLRGQAGGGSSGQRRRGGAGHGAEVHAPAGQDRGMAQEALAQHGAGAETAGRLLEGGVSRQGCAGGYNTDQVDLEQLGSQQEAGCVRNPFTGFFWRGRVQEDAQHTLESMKKARRRRMPLPLECPS